MFIEDFGHFVFDPVIFGFIITVLSLIIARQMKLKKKEFYELSETMN